MSFVAVSGFTRRVEAIEVNAHRFVVDASDLALPPGQFPSSLVTDLGNGQLLLLVQTDEAGALYRQAMGCIRLRVHNDWRSSSAARSPG